MATIVVTATSLRISGGLTILRQFVSNLPLSDDKYYIFVDPSHTCVPQDNIEYIPVATRSQWARLKFDFCGFAKELKRKDIRPDLIISLQNNGLRFDKRVPQIVYFHQTVPLHAKRWNLFKASERKMAVYKNIYSWVIRFFDNPSIHYIAQIPSIKKGIQQKFGISAQRIHIITPHLPDTPSLQNYSEQQAGSDKKIFLYPATPIPYKNHSLLIKALSVLFRKNPELKNEVELVFTFRQEEFPEAIRLAEKLGVRNNITADGPVPFDNLQLLYRNALALLFPSYIESFGLPLFEAAAAGLPILAADTDYAHDVVGKYEGTSFLNYRDPDSWADKILEIIRAPIRFQPYHPTETTGWKDFFALVGHLKK
ncbi:glycosyltransferase [uncultured Alistipes sp.]|uniref:glycosyltransferase n=1 Tax=uncultured Alistipes sp. TaxID=538949 RepID=UPI00272BB642|nr:glycosyltransferase [uncultured Alistipes sp.]